MRRKAKFAVFLVCYVAVFPLTLIALVEKWVFHASGLFCCFGQLLSLVPGRIGGFIRAGYYLHNLDQCSWDCRVGFGSFFSCRAVRFGREASIAAYTIVGCAVIEDHAMIGSRVTIAGVKRPRVDDREGLARDPFAAAVRIGAGSWIGDGVTVMADVGEQSIVSGGSVVSASTPPRAIAVGNPARALPSWTGQLYARVPPESRSDPTGSD